MKKAYYESNEGISIIVPVYNGEKYIENCLNMLLAQEGNYEIVVINDGSKDKTDEIITKFIGNDRIRYYKGPNQGVSAARNKGMSLSNNNWIIFADVDDEIAPGYVQDALETIARHRASDFLCYGHFALGNEDKTELEISSPEINVNMVISGEGIENATDYFMFGVWSKVFNKEFLQNNKILFNEQVVFSEDILFMVSAAAKAHNIAYIHRGYYRYLYNDGSICHSGGTEKDYNSYISYIEEMEQFRVNNSKLWKNTELMDNYNKRMNDFGILAVGRVRTGTRNINFGKRRTMIKTMGNIIYKHKYPKLDKKSKVKRFIIKYLPSAYIIIGDLK